MGVLTRTQMKMLAIPKKKEKKEITVTVKFKPGKRIWMFINGKPVLKEKV